MNLGKAAVGGLIGGLIGGAIWVIVGYVTHYEIGWIAWGVGAAAGFGVCAGSKGEAGQAGGVLAVVIAITSILAAKWIVVDMMVSDALKDDGEFMAELVPGVQDDEFWTSYTADLLISEREVQGQPVNWPPGMTFEEADSQADYPKHIWKDAAARWNAQSPDQRREFCETARPAIMANARAAMGEMSSSITRQGFLDSFGVMDLLFGFLAVASAFKLGSGDLAGKG